MLKPMVFFGCFFNSVSIKRRLSGLFAIVLFFYCAVKARNNAPRYNNFNVNWLFHFGYAANASQDFKYLIAAIVPKTGKKIEW